MNIVMIGTGNVANVVGRKLKAAGHYIVQVFGRNVEAANALALLLDASPCYEWKNIQQGASLYLSAVSDDAIAAMAKELRLNNALIAHTAGAVSKDVLKEISSNYGVFYPLQSLSKDAQLLPEIPMLIDGNNEASNNTLLDVAKTISSKVSKANDAERLQWHLAAVLVNNFTNHLYVLAERFCKEHDMEFKNLLPLIDATADRLQYFSPSQVQTGPAIRNDQHTIEKHLALLHDHPSLKKLYEMMTAGIQQSSIK